MHEIIEWKTDAHFQCSCRRNTHCPWSEHLRGRSGRKSWGVGPRQNGRWSGHRNCCYMLVCYWFSHTTNLIYRWQVLIGTKCWDWRVKKVYFALQSSIFLLHFLTGFNRLKIVTCESIKHWSLRRNYLHPHICPWAFAAAPQVFCWHLVAFADCLSFHSVLLTYLSNIQ